MKGSIAHCNAGPSAEEARGGCGVLEEEEPGLGPVVLVPQETTGVERSCGLLEDREPGGNSLVPIPQEPAGGGGGVGAATEGGEGGLDVGRSSLQPTSLSPTLNPLMLKLKRKPMTDSATKVKGKKQNGRQKVEPEMKMDSMRELMKRWTGSASPATAAAQGHEGEAVRWEKFSSQAGTAVEPAKEVAKVKEVTRRKNSVLSRWKEAKEPDTTFEDWKRSRQAVKRKNSELQEPNPFLDSIAGNNLHNKKLCVSENNYKKINTNLSCHSKGTAGTPGGGDGGQDRLHLPAGGGNGGTADLGAPGARAKIKITGADWLQRLGEESERKAMIRKKAGGTGVKK